MKPFNSGGHTAYQERVLAQLRKYYPDAAASLPPSTWEIMEKFWNPDLSAVDILMADRYSVCGPPPRLPSDMIRSILLSVEFKTASYTKWAADLKENHLHAILSGFYVGDTPGVGTFYDFQNRLWLSDKDNLSEPVHPPKDMAPCQLLYDIFKTLFPDHSVQEGLISLLGLSLAGDGTPVYTAAQERRKRTCLFSLSLDPLQGMIPLASFITGSP